jgi:hypothetical protein
VLSKKRTLERHENEENVGAEGVKFLLVGGRHRTRMRVTIMFTLAIPRLESESENEGNDLSRQAKAFSGLQQLR